MMFNVQYEFYLKKVKNKHSCKPEKKKRNSKKNDKIHI